MRYRVHLVPPHGAKRKSKPRIVEAEYFKVENGLLIFRIRQRGDYPLTVHVFAPGVWSDVELVVE